MTNQLKLHHWQTHDFATHKATDEVLSKLMDLVDEYVEVYMGRYKRSRVPSGCVIHLKNLTEKTAEKFVKECIVHLQTGLVKTKDTDLLNIRDEILGALHRLLYLLTLQ